MTHRTIDAPNIDPQSRWDDFGSLADSNKPVGEPHVGRAADVRTRVNRGFQPQKVAPITVISGREIYDGLKELGPVLGDGGPTLERDPKVMVPVASVATRHEAIVIPVEALQDMPVVIPVNIRLA